MKINFKHIIIDNFLSFGHAEFSFENRGFTLIRGVNNSSKDNAVSNGSGKSSLFNALCFALTGETIQGLSASLNNIFTGGDLCVDLEFSIDNTLYRIVRSRDTKNKADLKIYINGEDKSGKGVRESEALLAQYLPELTSDMIGEIILIGQGMPHKFSDNSPSGRKELLEKLSQSDFMVEDLRGRIETRAHTLQERAAQLEESYIKASTEENLIKKDLQKADEEYALKYKSQQPRDYTAELQQIQTALTQNDGQRTQLQKQLEKVQKDIESVNQDNIKLIQQQNGELEQETKVFNEHNLDIKTQLSESNARKQYLLEEVRKLEAIKDVCPTCGQKLPHVHKADTTEQKAELQVLGERIAQLTEKNNKQQEAFKLNKQAIQAEYAEKIEQINTQLSALRTQAHDLNKQIATLNTADYNLKSSQTRIEQEQQSFASNKAALEQRIAELQTRDQALEHSLLYINKDREDVQKHSDIVTKMLTYVKRDFRGILLQNVISYIDGVAKDYCNDIFKTREISFKLEGNNVSITYLNKPLEALSGGEQQKVDLILQFAIRKMMTDYRGFSSNILVLDEVLDNLDERGCDAVLGFITAKLCDIESIFIISHHADSLNIGNDSTVTITKNENGVSSITA